MNIQIYKYINSPIEYLVFDLDAPCTSTEAKRAGWEKEFEPVYYGLRLFPESDGLCSICSSTKPLSLIERSATKSSFLDLLVVAGFSQANVEFILTSFPLSSFTITVRPRSLGVDWGFNLI